MVRNKTILASFLLCVFLIPALSFLALQAAQLWVKFERKEAMEKEQLQVLVLPEKDIYWEEEGVELKINGHYFDL